MLISHRWWNPVVVGLCCLVLVVRGEDAKHASPSFRPEHDLLSLHYDHAPDKDDGQSAAADRTVLESLFGALWLPMHVVPVSGTYGENRGDFNPDSDAVMDAVWNDCGGWIKGHRERDKAVEQLTSRWVKTLQAGGDVWIKEGGQSDLTSVVVERIKKLQPDLATTKRIHVVQHADWNEEQTTDSALEYAKQHTHYVRIRDANAYLNVQGNDQFVQAAADHPIFGAHWRAAFIYYDPNERLDFSDTGELMDILGLGELSIDDFRKRFLEKPGD